MLERRYSAAVAVLLILTTPFWESIEPFTPLFVEMRWGAFHFTFKPVFAACILGVWGWVCFGQIRRHFVQTLRASWLPAALIGGVFALCLISTLLTDRRFSSGLLNLFVFYGVFLLSLGYGPFLFGDPRREERSLALLGLANLFYGFSLVVVASRSENWLYNANVYRPQITLSYLVFFCLWIRSLGSCRFFSGKSLGYGVLVLLSFFLVIASRGRAALAVCMFYSYFMLIYCGVHKAGLSARAVIGVACAGFLLLFSLLSLTTDILKKSILDPGTLKWVRGSIVLAWVLGLIFLQRAVNRDLYTRLLRFLAGGALLFLAVYAVSSGINAVSQKAVQQTIVRDFNMMVMENLYRDVDATVHHTTNHYPEAIKHIESRWLKLLLTSLDYHRCIIHGYAYFFAGEYFPLGRGVYHVIDASRLQSDAFINPGSAHSSYLYLVFSGGWPALGAYLWVLARAFRRKTLAPVRMLFSSLVLVGFFSNELYQFTHWFLLGMLVSPEGSQ